MQSGQRKHRATRRRIPLFLQFLSSRFSNVEYTFAWYSTSVGNKWYSCHNSKDKADCRKAPILDLLIISTYLLSWSYRLNYPIILNKLPQSMIKNGSPWITQFHKGYTENHLNHTIPYPNHLISRGSQTAHNRELGYHDSCTLCKGYYLVPTCSDFITDQATRKPSFCHTLLFLWCMAQR
jgi:hypothetical protein